MGLPKPTRWVELADLVPLEVQTEPQILAMVVVAALIGWELDCRPSAATADLESSSSATSGTNEDGGGLSTKEVIGPRFQQMQASRIERTSRRSDSGAVPIRLAAREFQSMDFTCSTMTTPVTVSPSGIDTWNG